MWVGTDGRQARSRASGIWGRLNHSIGRINSSAYRLCRMYVWGVLTCNGAGRSTKPIALATELERCDAEEACDYNRR
jgi:hypothetical protein